MRVILCFILCMMLIPTALAGWPRFSVPTRSEIFAAAQVMPAQCQARQRLLQAGQVFPIEANYIEPEHWAWVYAGPSRCIKQQLVYQKLTVTQAKYPGEIIASYRQQQGQELDFIFHVPPGHWDCGELISGQPARMIGCAMDQ